MKQPGDNRGHRKTDKMAQITINVHIDVTVDLGDDPKTLAVKNGSPEEREFKESL